MKKTLVALAVVAASGAAFAQASITGVIGMEIGKVGANAGTFDLHDTALSFQAKEDLGGGLSIATVMNVNNFGGRQRVYANEDAFLTLSGGFGAVKMGNYEGGNGIIGRAYAGAPLIASDNGVILAGGANVRGIGYTSPSFSGFAFTAGISSGAGTFDGHSTGLGVKFDGGPISAGVDYDTNAERTRASASYDLGFAKVGAGYENRRVGGAGRNMAVGVSAPFGALTVGAAYSKNIDALSSTTAASDASALEFGASYALSKRTSVSAGYKLHNDQAEAATGADSHMRVRLTHAF